jgi:hypothetical protein
MLGSVDVVKIEAPAVILDQQSYEAIAIPYAEMDLGCMRVTNSVVESFLGDLVQE